jgi:hypothetical protein
MGGEENVSLDELFAIAVGRLDAIRGEMKNHVGGDTGQRFSQSANLKRGNFDRGCAGMHSLSRSHQAGNFDSLF